MEDYDEDLYDDEDSYFESCPKCGRWYDHIGFDLQYCKACGWDAEKKKWDKPIEPADEDYMSGDADILTGRWY